MKSQEEREVLRIRSVEDLHEAIQYLDRTYGVEESTLAFPDGLPLVSVTYVLRTLKDGTEASELVFSDRWPEGAVPGKGFELHRAHFCNGEEGD
jgi:hypothetical protein